MAAANILAVGLLVGAVTLALSTMRASKHFHNVMLARILRCSTSFFDQTPTGRVVNRFAKDLDTVDTNIPQNLRIWITTVLRVHVHYVFPLCDVPW